MGLRLHSSHSTTAIPLIRLGRGGGGGQSKSQSQVCNEHFPEHPQRLRQAAVSAMLLVLSGDSRQSERLEEAKKIAIDTVCASLQGCRGSQLGVGLCRTRSVADRSHDCHL